MTSLLLVGAVLSAALGASTIEGRVVDANNQPVAHAQVFLEPGLGGALLDTITPESGAFRFDAVEPGPAGVFAVAPGHGMGGRHLDLSVGDVVPPLTITLGKPREISGTIADPGGKPVEGARITRIGLKSAHKVGIPLAKLRQFGYPEPVSDAAGRFTLTGLPEGALIDLKVGHASYAQEGIMDVPVGQQGVKITMHPGVLVEGLIFARANQAAVGQAAILIKNAQPPFDTTTNRANLSGKFTIRLKPGVYLYRAEGAGLRTPGWERLVITGERPIEQMRAYVAGTGTIRGNVRDALSGEPVRNVRVVLSTNDATAAVVRTGPGGDFAFTAGEGDNIIRIDATPGYFPPDNQNVKVSLAEGADVALPGMWLKPLPAYGIQVLDSAGAPVPGAIVTLLRPRQLGWYTADGDGRTSLRVQHFPEEGALLGRAEHPDRPEVALFRLEKSQDAPGSVQLFAAASVNGKVVNRRGRGLPGASIGAFFPGESASDAVLLWQTFSGPDGAFQWEAVAPGVPQRLAARDASGASAESETFNLAPGEIKTLGDIPLDGPGKGKSALGSELPWRSWELRCGQLPAGSGEAAARALLVFAGAAEAPIYLEALTQLQTLAAAPDLVIALVTLADIPCEDSPLPVLAGAAPGDASVLMLDTAGRVVFESNALPPLFLLRNR
ncbi:MAG: carboxypeptidase regulatory-like domain-containing protein [Candidatus Hydrogenedentes bacterium]|nr:carboxypeptidase regulatory-like domain-containing protein [Candidatus Hydrogenedentota bacterium]